MAGTGQLPTTPLQMLQRGLVNAATGMRSGGTTDLLDLRPLAVLKSTVDTIRKSNPRIAAMMGVVAPFALLTYAVHEYIWQFFNLHALVKRVQRSFLSSLVIPYDHAMRGMVLNWVAMHTVTRGNSASLHQDGELFFDPAAGDGAIEYIPNVATSWFTFDGRSFRLELGSEKAVQVYDEDDVPVAGFSEMQPSAITISCHTFGSDLDPIKRFLAHVRREELNNLNGETRTYRMHKDPRKGWANAIFRPVRNMDSVSMELDTKTSLLLDVKTFLSEQSKKWYCGRGIPWRRGYLLYGPPGTGKTSFASAVAGHFGLSVYVINLSNPILTDDLLDTIMSQLPSEKIVVLMEDVDSAGIQRSTVSEPGKNVPPKKGITMAGLLNCLDGPCSAEGRLLILTSNIPDSLDPALVRPGRIDRKILFGNASYEIMRTMFLHIFTDVPGETSTNSTDYDLKQLAVTFASQLPEDQITPPELQNFLLEHRNSPVDAVNNVKAWADAVLLSKIRGRNVAHFTDQIGDVESGASIALSAAAVNADSNASVTADTSPDLRSETGDAAAGVDATDDQTEASDKDEGDRQHDGFDSGDDDRESDSEEGGGGGRLMQRVLGIRSANTSALSLKGTCIPKALEGLSLEPNVSVHGKGEYVEGMVV